MSEKVVAPTTKVDFTGVTDKDYNPSCRLCKQIQCRLRTFDLVDFDLLFDRTSRRASKIPGENDIVHFVNMESLMFTNYQKSYIFMLEITGHRSLKLQSDLQLSDVALDFNDLRQRWCLYDRSKLWQRVSFKR